MNGFLLDTNVVAEISGKRADARVRQWFDAQDESTLFLSILTIGEYQKGIHNLPVGDPRRAPLAAAVAALEERFTRRILSVSDAIVRRWGVLSGEIKRKTGHAPSVIDTLLAATALERHLYLITRNVHDFKHTESQVFNPWKNDLNGLRVRRL
ncbi:MAG: type II toxin-antitoxin system VapC family toxin [Acidobacteriaceae bacterium]